MKHIATVILAACAYTGTIHIQAQTTTSTQQDIKTDSTIYSNLDEITISARRKAVKISADKIAYTPSSMISKNTGSVYDALLSIPGISISSDGNVTVNGTQTAGISIEGRKTILNDTELISFLRTLSVSDIEKIEIINSVTSKREGSEPGTIINLVKRHEKEDGGTLGMNMDGQLWKARQIFGSLFAEYRHLNHSVTLGYSAYMSHNPSELLTDRPYMKSSARLSQTYSRLRKDNTHNISLAYEGMPGQNLTLGASINYNRFHRDEPAIMTTMLPQAAEQIETTNKALFTTGNIYGDIYVRHNRNPHTDWTAAFDFFNYKNRERQFMKDNAGLEISGGITGQTSGLVGSFDFNRSLSTHWRLSTGARFSYVHMSSTGLYDSSSSMDILGQTDYSDNLDSSFGYNENVNALYIEGKATYGNMTATLGLRTEQSNLHMHFSGNETAGVNDISRHKFRLYPSMAFILSTSTAGSWMMSYTNRVMRPRFADLDPFIHIFDDITHVGGNINLKESLTNAMTVTWTDNRMIRIMLAGEITSDEITKCYRELTDKVVYVSPENLPRHLQFILSGSINDIKINSWWTIAAQANMIYSNYHFPDNMELASKVRFTPAAEVNNSFFLPYDITAEVKTSYRGPSAYGQARISSIWNTYIGFKKNFLKGRLCVSIYMKDIFNTNRISSSIYLSGQQATLHEKEFENMRKAGISVSYILKSGKETSKDKNRNTWIDELNRVSL